MSAAWAAVLARPRPARGRARPSTRPPLVHHSRAATPRCAALNQHGGYFKNHEVMFWREGQGEWKPLRELAELQHALQQAPPAGGADAAAAAPAAAGGGPPPAAGRRRGAAAAAAAAVPADPQLAGFLSEISALGAEGEGEGGDAEAGAPASPPADERQFEDDDGTVYVWHSGLRKFMPLGEGQAGGAAGPAAAPAAPYNEQDMVFVPEEEQLPEYVPPPKASLGGSRWGGRRRRGCRAVCAGTRARQAQRWLAGAAGRVSRRGRLPCRPSRLPPAACPAVC